MQILFVVNHAAKSTHTKKQKQKKMKKKLNESDVYFLIRNSCVPVALLCLLDKFLNVFLLPILNDQLQAILIILTMKLKFFFLMALIRVNLLRIWIRTKFRQFIKHDFLFFAYFILPVKRDAKGEWR